MPPIKLISSSLGGNFPHGVPIGIVYSLEGEEEGGSLFILRNKVNLALKLQSDHFADD